MQPAYYTQMTAGPVTVAKGRYLSYM